MRILRLMLNDVRYRVVCAFTDDNQTRDKYAARWNAAFEAYRLSLPRILDSRLLTACNSASRQTGRLAYLDRTLSTKGRF